MTLFIPSTSKECYISDIVALNIHSPAGTGDWHTASALSGTVPLPENIYLYGKERPCNTNHILGDLGIIDGTERLHKMGVFAEHEPVYIADHPRACFDMIYTVVLEKGLLNSIILDDWFPNTEDKQSVYDLLDIAEPLLNAGQKERLQQWKCRNPLQ